MTLGTYVRRFFFALALVPALGLETAPARANDPATAQVLFDQARKLMAEERWAEACPKLAESQRLDPGGGTLLHLAVCRDHEGKIATAWAVYREALETATRDGRKDRIRVAQARMEALEPKLPRLTVRVPVADQKLPDLEIRRDDVRVGEAQWGQSVPVDPGSRTIVARATGYRAWTTNVVVPLGSADLVVDIPELVREPAPSPVLTTPAGGRGRGRGRGEGERDESMPTQRVLGLVAGGVGIAAAVGGSIFGVMALSKTSEADGVCDPRTGGVQCPAAGIDAHNASLTFGTVSTILFSAGAAFLVAGTVLYLTAPDAGAPARVGRVGRFLRGLGQF